MKQATVARRRAKRSTPLGSVLIESLQQRWEKYLKELARVKKSPTEEAIHDFRVATRRLISTLMIVELLIPEKRVEDLRRRLKKLFDACSPLRDTQVQLLTLESQVAQHPELEMLITILKVREHDLIATIAKKIKKATTAKWGGTMRWIMQAVREQFSHPLMHEAATAVVLGAAARTFATAVYFMHGVVATEPRTIHQARIAFKKFRYTMEALVPLLPHLDKDRLRAMDAYQTRMGVIQDAEVLGEVVQRYAAKRPVASRRKLAGFQTQLGRQKRQLITDYIKARHEIFSFWQPPSADLRRSQDGRD
ncbi:MAG TPA: CHAD domain-containing protein [Bacteroidota bacterium]|nr:CHAD domain-containing protein [Bacteroidota bacterium]